MNKIDLKELHEIFQGLKNQDQNSYNLLYEKYYKLVYGIVFSIIKNKADSEDIVQEIFTKVYKMDTAKLPLDHEASWLFTVSKNECLLFLRKSKPNISIDEIYEMPENSNGIDNIIDEDYFNRLISRLKEDEKIIVSLKILSNFTFKKISQVMNIPIGTVQWKYYNAINSLKVSIGSLLGSVLAFIIVIARGEFWKKKNYLKNKATNEINMEDNKVDNIVNEDANEIKDTQQDNTDNAQQSEEIHENQNLQDSIKSQDSNKSQDSTYIQESNTSSNVQYNEVYNEKFSDRIDGIQITCLTIGIILFVFFIVFFKKYQKKLKGKSSK